MDFILKTYITLIKTLQKNGYSFKPFEEYLSDPGIRTIILRHDVDRFPENSLAFATIQHQLGIRGSYYFRMARESWNEQIIREIAAMGHEVGYHYEDVSLIAERQKTKVKRQKKINGIKVQGHIGPKGEGNIDSTLQPLSSSTEEELAELAIEIFKENLDRMRQIVPVKTICMHGSPMSKWDSRLLWKYFDYQDFGIVGEPYFDVNFDEVLYLTDTGRRWDGVFFNVRDKSINRKVRNDVAKYAKENLPLSSSPSHPIFPSFHSTFDIIKAAEVGLLPDKIMMTFHPQRWTDTSLLWIKELVFQNIKNIAKFVLIRIRK